MKTKFKSYGYYIGVAIMGIAIGSLLQFAKAWAEPTAAPPNSNVGAPINTSANSQVKSGFLTAGAVISPVMCIGSDCKSAWPSASGDNLGNHIATQDLNMNGKKITNLANISTTGNLNISGSVTVNIGGTNLSLKAINGSEDTYTGETANCIIGGTCVSDSCNGDKTNEFQCGVTDSKSCVDVYRSCNTDGTRCGGMRRDVTCKKVFVFSE